MKGYTPVVLLLRAFIQGRLTAGEFSRIYFQLSSCDDVLPKVDNQRGVDNEALDAILSLRSDCDAFEDDPRLLQELRESGPSHSYWLDDEMLKARALCTLKIVESKGYF